MSLTSCAAFEGVVVDVVVTTPQADADTILGIFDVVVVDLGIERFQDGNTGVLHVVDYVV